MLARQTPPPSPPQSPQPNTTTKVTITSNHQSYLTIHVVVSPPLFSARESTVTPSVTHRRRRRKTAVLWAFCGKFSIDAKLSSKIRSLDFVMSKLFPTRCASHVNENLACRVSRSFCFNPTAEFLFGNNLGHIQIRSKIQRGDGYPQ